MNELPAGTVTLLMADVEDSARLRQTAHMEIATAVARLEAVLGPLIERHDGVQAVSQGESACFTVAFARASDAVACALHLQIAPLAPIRLRIGVHTGEVGKGTAANHSGPTFARAARLRDLAQAGQALLSGATESIVCDRLPSGAWLVELGSDTLGDLPRPQRIWQLCHPDLCNDHAALRAERPAAHRVPTRMTDFVGRSHQVGEISHALIDHRLVTLVGAAGVGKTRLALRVAAGSRDDVCFVDSAAGTGSGADFAVARALNLPDQPGRSTLESIIAFLEDRRLLLVIDDGEHLLDAIAEVSDACPQVTVLATSREPLGVPEETVLVVPALSLTGEAPDLFARRARLVLPDFAIGDDNAATVVEICRRLDGNPLAIELAAARLRTLSLTEICDALAGRHRALPGTVDWSHALLTEPERVLLRRLGVFVGGFDGDAARSVTGGDDLGPHQVPDLLSLLVGKSLVIADDSRGPTRYRLPDALREYALEKLDASGESDAVRDRHRDHYRAITAVVDVPTHDNREQRIERAVAEMGNIRAAFTWSIEAGDTGRALAIASSLLPVWLADGRMREGLSWFDEAGGMPGAVPPAVQARALADRAVLSVRAAVPCGQDAHRALDIARRLGDRALELRALTACGVVDASSATAPPWDMSEAATLARELGDRWRLSQILALQQCAAQVAGDLAAVIRTGDEGLALATELGDRFVARTCRLGLGVAHLLQGALSRAADLLRRVVAEADADRDVIHGAAGRIGQAHLSAFCGRHESALAAAREAVALCDGLSGHGAGPAHGALAVAALAAGDLDTAARASADAAERSHIGPAALVALLQGDAEAARHYGDAAVAAAGGWHLMTALMIRARIAVADADHDRAYRDAHRALRVSREIGSDLGVPDILETLAAVDCAAQNHCEAARLVAAADSIRHRLGSCRFKVYEPWHRNLTHRIRDGLDADDFADAWDQGGALSVEQAIAYAQRGRGERKRPSTGWESLTPTERDVVAFLAEGLGNKEIAERLFMSPRTVQTHLTHVYAKLGLHSRVAVAQEAGRRLASER